MMNMSKFNVFIVFFVLCSWLLCENAKGARKEAVTLHSSEVDVEQQKRVNGKVTDNSGQPIIGASVVVKDDATHGTVTDMDGNYTLSDILSDARLIISYVGMKTQEIEVRGRTTIDIVLLEDSELLDEVVVVGYGVQKKVNVTGAVSSIDSKALESRPVQNVTQALQGVIPGLDITQTNAGGTLNSQMNINIRGLGTIGAGSSGAPLVLIDGVEGNINAINPADVQSISVLKDAASASIYGARAAFGVILVTTKSGKSGRTNVSYQANVRFSDANQIPRMLDSYRFAQYFNEAARNSGQGAVFSEDALRNIKDYIAYHDGSFTGTLTDENRDAVMYGTRAGSNNRWLLYGGGSANTDWFKEMYRNWSPSQEHNLSISGGTEKVTYLISGNFLDQKGLIRHGKDKFNRYSLNGKINARVSDWFSINYNNRWVREEYSRPSYMTGLFFHNIARRWPTNAVLDPNGHYIEGNEILQMRDGGIDRDQKDYLYQQLQFEFEPVKDWFIRLEGNYNTINRFNHWDVLPIIAYDSDNEPFYAPWSGGDAGQSRVSETAWRENFMSTKIYTDYTKTLDDMHTFTGLLGTDIHLMKTRNVGGTKKDLITPLVPTINTATNDTPSLYGGYGHWSTLGFFGRLNYNFMEKYLFEANVRRDGTSRFVGNKTWGIFPSFSVGWNVARENFFAPLSDRISSLKLRASWGQLGNMNTNAWYPFFLAMPIGTGNGSWLVDGKRPNTSSAPGIVSSLMTWETIQSWDVGLDWIALNGRFTGTLDVFNRTTKDMIGPAPELSDILGTGVPKVNNADMESYGWELEMNWRDRIRDFSYGIKLVLSDNREKILRYPNDTKNLNNWYAGEIRGDIWGYTTAGIAQTDQEMQDHLANNKPTWGRDWTAGDIMYRDLNGDKEVNSGKGTLDDHGDLKIIGNSYPRYKFGLTLDGAWKGVDFRVFLQGVGKRDYVLGGPYFWGAAGGMWQSAGFEEHWDFWRGTDHPLGANPNAYYPRPLFDNSKNQYTQTRYLQNAAYLRVKNIQLGYTFSQKMIQKAGMQSVRVYLSGDNMVTFSQITGIFDPELLGGDWGPGKLYPLSKVMSVGLNINF